MKDLIVCIEKQIISLYQHLNAFNAYNKLKLLVLSLFSIFKSNTFLYICLKVRLLLR